MKGENRLTSTTKILNTIYSVIVFLFLLDTLPGFDIKDQTLKSLVYFGLLIGAPLILIWNFYFLRSKVMRIIGTVMPAIVLTLIFIVGPRKIILSSGSWRTQTILYKHGHLNFRTIEFQMQNVGALGFNKRTVEVLYLTDIFMVSNEVPNDIDNRVEWERVNVDVNEHGLKFTQ